MTDHHATGSRTAEFCAGYEFGYGDGLVGEYNKRMGIGSETEEAEIKGDTAVEVVELLVKDALMRGRISPNTARQVMFGCVGGVMAMTDPREGASKPVRATPDRAAKAAEVIERFLRGTGPWRPLVRGPIHQRWMRECAEAVVAAVEEPGDD